MFGGKRNQRSWSRIGAERSSGTTAAAGVATLSLARAQMWLEENLRLDLEKPARAVRRSEQKAVY